MGQANHPKAHQHPERGHKGWRKDVIRALRRDQFRVDGFQRFDGVAQATSSMHNAHQQNKGANKHHQTLHRIVQHAGAESAKRGIQRNADSEDDQACLVGNTRRRFQQACPADKLHRHCANKGHQQA